MKQRLFAFLFFAAVCFGFILSGEGAQAFSIFPLRHTVVVDSGKSQTVFVDVSNESLNEITVYPEVDAFELDPETGAIKFGTSDVAKSWIEPEVKMLRVSAQKKERMNFTITVPAGTLPGSHYLGLFAKEKSKGGQVGLGSRIGTLLFLHVAGKVEEKLQIQDFSSENFWNFSSRVELFVQLYNNGTIHLLPGGQIELTNFHGDIVEKILVNKENRKVLPLEVWKHSYAVQSLSWKDVGRVHAKLVTVYGVTNQVVLAEKVFWYTPWWFLTIFGILGTLGLVGVVFGIKKIVKQTLRRVKK